LRLRAESTLEAVEETIVGVVVHKRLESQSITAMLHRNIIRPTFFEWML
jgi:hypothetical protein